MTILILLPLIFFLLINLDYFKFNINNLYLVFIYFNLINLILILIYIYEVIYKNNIYLYKLLNILNLGIFNLNIYFIYNKLSIIFIILIITISNIVILYSFYYMYNDPLFNKFISYLYLFSFSMLLLVNSSSFFILFISWELVGLLSYLLINYWYTRIFSLTSSYKALLFNKIGDLGLVYGYMILYSNCYLFFFTNINKIFINNLKPLFCLLILLAICSKSAQIGLHLWLPDAMEGPTPVSALLHAATMVTAGIFLLIKFSCLFINFTILLIILVILGSITCLLTSIIGFFQSDIKKLIAYSTCSQLGYLLLILGFSLNNLSLFHLFNHGFFKCLLFLGSGIIIHQFYLEQNMYKIGKLIFFYNILYLFFIVSSLSLIGFTFTSGFFSKDLLIELVNFSNIFFFSILIIIFGSIFSILYSFKLINYLFFSKLNFVYIYKYTGFKNIILYFLLTILFILTFISGYFFYYIIIINNIFININIINKNLPIIIIFILIFLYYYFNNKIIYIKIKIKNLILDLFYLNFINYIYLYKLFNKNYNKVYFLIDLRILEYIGPYKIKLILNKLFKKIIKIHSGYINSYIFLFIIFTFLIIL